MLKVKLNNNDAYPPKRANEFAAGYDLYASEECVIEPHKHKIVKTGMIREKFNNSSAIIDNNISNNHKLLILFALPMI